MISTDEIINKFIHGGWQGLTKVDDYILIDKRITKFTIGQGPSYLFILENIKTGKFYKVEYSVFYKNALFVPAKIVINEPLEVFPDKKQTVFYATENELLDEVLKMGI